MRWKLISCEVLFREMCDALVHSPVTIDVEFLSKGLHDLGGKAMAARLQELCDATDPTEYDTILMGYALCGNGLAGLQAKQIRIVAPVAHDCIALLMGSRAKYQDYFDANPGTYFRSTGWLERGAGLMQLARPKAGAGYSLEELVAKYGEENGQFLYEEMSRYKQTYSRLTYIETGLEPDRRFIDAAREEAEERGWQFEKLPGELSLFRRLVTGDWTSGDFAVAEPGHKLVAKWDGSILGVERITS